MAEIIRIEDLMERQAVEDVTKKQFLKRYKPICGRIESKMEEIERINNSLYPGAIILDRIGGGGSHTSTSDKIDNALDYVNEHRAARIAELKELTAVRDEIAEAINRIPDEDLKWLLELRYINFYGWKKVAEKMGYTEDNVYKLHSAALRQLRIKKCA